jgi:hypothetical protein
MDFFYHVVSRVCDRGTCSLYPSCRNVNLLKVVWYDMIEKKTIEITRYIFQRIFNMNKFFKESYQCCLISKYLSYLQSFFSKKSEISKLFFCNLFIFQVPNYPLRRSKIPKKNYQIKNNNKFHV